MAVGEVRYQIPYALDRVGELQRFFRVTQELADRSEIENLNLQHRILLYPDPPAEVW